jgi:hypothetical protein
MKISKMFFTLLVAVGLIFSATTSALASEGDDSKETPNDYVGWATSSTSDNLPGIQPNAVNPVPGGGYATAQSSLGWTAARMDGIANTSLSANAQGTFSLCATSTQVYKNGVPKGGAGQVCGSRTGGGSVQSKKSVYEYVFGHSWRLDTNHAATASGYSWYPSLTIYATP